jgi:hypothetical protein
LRPKSQFCAACIRKAAVLISQVFFEIDVMGLYRTTASKCSSFSLLDFRLDDIHPQIAVLLELLKNRDELDEMTELFEKYSQPWKNLSQYDRNRLIHRASSLISQSEFRSEDSTRSTNRAMAK